jgi:hypothetical protein
MGIEVVLHQTNILNTGVVLLDQIFHKLSIVDCCSLLTDFNIAQPRMRLKGQHTGSRTLGCLKTPSREPF